MTQPSPLAPTRRALLGSLAAVLCAGLTLLGCGGSSSGRPTASGQGNFVVTNNDVKTVHVFVSGSEVGSVTPGASQDFRIDPGLRLVEFRERGETVLRSHGAYTFSTTTTLNLRYDPGFAFNLRVVNQRTDTIEVFADFTSYGGVGPGQTATFRIVTGRRDLDFRPVSSSTATFFGTYNFNHTDVVEVTAQ